jgi:hypothetical protein
MLFLTIYCMTTLKLQYVLLGKFQTDYLEFRFSQYRQMSGANYNVSVVQIMESEKRLKIVSFMKIFKCGNRMLSLKDFITGCQTEILSSEQPDSDAICLSQFLSVLNDCDDVTIADNEMSGIVFIAGYVGYKLKAKIDCTLELLTDKALECDYPSDESFDYLSAIDRGRLTWPTDFMVEIVVQTVIVFKCLVSSKFISQFSTVHNQRSVLHQ